MKLNKKEEKLFVKSLLMGLVLGILGNLFVTSFYDYITLIEKVSILERGLLFLISFTLTLSIIYWFSKKI